MDIIEKTTDRAIWTIANILGGVVTKAMAERHLIVEQAIGTLVILAICMVVNVRIKTYTQPWARGLVTGVAKYTDLTSLVMVVLLSQSVVSWLVARPLPMDIIDIVVITFSALIVIVTFTVRINLK